jgi:hypothetical protein
VRVTTALNRMLAIPGADVTGASITPAGVVVTCAGERRGSAAGMRVHNENCLRPIHPLVGHLDLGASWLSLGPRSAGSAASVRSGRDRAGPLGPVRVPSTPAITKTWSPSSPNARTSPRSLACSGCPGRPSTGSSSGSWPTPSTTPVDHLDLIGMDEVSCARVTGASVLTDHDRDSRVVWSAEGGHPDQLLHRTRPGAHGQTEAISADMGAGYQKAIASQLGRRPHRT